MPLPGEWQYRVGVGHEMQDSVLVLGAWGAQPAFTGSLCLASLSTDAGCLDHPGKCQVLYELGNYGACTIAPFKATEQGYQILLAYS